MYKVFRDVYAMLCLIALLMLDDCCRSPCKLWNWLGYRHLVLELLYSADKEDQSAK